MRCSLAIRLDTAKVHYKLVKKDLGSTVTRDLLFWDEEWRPGSGGILRHKLGVVCRGSLIQLLVEGLKVNEFRDESFSDGLVGAVLFGEGHAVFDDLLAQSIVESGSCGWREIVGHVEGHPPCLAAGFLPQPMTIHSVVNSIARSPGLRPPSPTGEGEVCSRNAATLMRIYLCRSV